MTDPNDMQSWWPALAASGVPVPRTWIIPTEVDLFRLLDNGTPDGYDPLLLQICEAVACLGGYPVFIRSTYTSGKHIREKGGRVDCTGDVDQTLHDLAEFSFCVDLRGVPLNGIVVREFLKLEHAFTAFQELPIAKERRYFIMNGRVVCHHPYWPEEAIRQSRVRPPLWVWDRNRDATIFRFRNDWPQLLAQLNEEDSDEVFWLTRLSERVSAQLPGHWSLDWAKTTAGNWYAIDMADAAHSWHPEGCPYRTA